MIDKKEKSAHGAATPLGTQLNRQEQYNTDQEKIEPIKLAQEIFALCMKIQEGEDGKVEHRKKGRKEKFSFYLGDYWGHQQKERAIKCKERLIELLEERRGSGNEE